MSGLVLDASAALGLALKGSDPAFARAACAATRLDPAVVPALFWFEVRNGLATAQRHKLIDAVGRATFLAALAGLSIEVDGDPDEKACFDLAERHVRTFYDAVYLELAIRRGLPIARLDKALRRACGAAGVALFSLPDTAP